MESIEKEYELLRKKSNLSRSISDVDKCIQLLQNARAAIAAGTYSSSPPSSPLLSPVYHSQQSRVTDWPQIPPPPP